MLITYAINYKFDVLNLGSGSLGIPDVVVVETADVGLEVAIGVDVDVSHEEFVQ